MFSLANLSNNRKRKVSKEQTIVSFLMILPALVVMIATILFPILWSFRISLSSSNTVLNQEYKFIGLDNYVTVLVSKQFQNALLNTWVFVVATIVCELIIGMCMALILNKNLPGNKLFTLIFTLPLMIAPVVAGLQWRWLFADQYGVVNYVLGIIGIKGPLWLAGPISAKFAILISNIWLAVPFTILVLLAALSSFPEELYEAAYIDGAKGMQIFRFITLPMLKPAILTILVVRFADAFRVFDLVYIMTQGGPGDATEVLSTYIYKQIFTYLNFGEGSAASFIVVIILLIITNLLFKLLRSKEE